MNAVWKDQSLNPLQKLVKLQLADRADDEGLNCYPSVRTICLTTGLSERSVQRILSTLREKGHVEQLTNGSGRQSSRYRVLASANSKVAKNEAQKISERRATLIAGHKETVGGVPDSHLSKREVSISHPRGALPVTPGVSTQSPNPPSTHQRTTKDDVRKERPGKTGLTERYAESTPTPPQATLSGADTGEAASASQSPLPSDAPANLAKIRHVLAEWRRLRPDPQRVAAK
jgi:hypothetical protein